MRFALTSLAAAGVERQPMVAGACQARRKRLQAPKQGAVVIWTKETAKRLKRLLPLAAGRGAGETLGVLETEGAGRTRAVALPTIRKPAWLCPGATFKTAATTVAGVSATSLTVPSNLRNLAQLHAAGSTKRAETGLRRQGASDLPQRKAGWENP
mmetsp:Transcript_69212/g.162676  ORF Transcript_69212/g.162676 Transcript_69212/m.162676 type:complete len:155 (+) Transcript_69212:301-765(+)